MPDQATELRNLVLRAARDIAAHENPAPRLVVLTGGKGGVGVTTMSVNLAVSLAQQGARVVLVDADLHRADVATLCGLTERGDVADVMASRRDIHEVLIRGPAGIQIVPGLWAPGRTEDYSPRNLERLVKQLHLLGRHAELVIVDVGSGSHDVLRRFWRAADEVLMVTTPDSYAVMDAYAMIKTLVAHQTAPTIRLIVNHCEQDLGADVQRRVDQSCRRFLGFGVGLLGAMPQDASIPTAATRQVPYVLFQPRQAPARSLEQMAQHLLLGDGPAAKAA